MGGFTKFAMLVMALSMVSCGNRGGKEKEVTEPVPVEENKVEWILDSTYVDCNR